MSASNCYTEGSGVGSHGENVRASNSSAARLQSFNSQERDGYDDDSMYIPRERSFLVSIRLAILLVTLMIIVVQTAEQLVLKRERRIVCFKHIVYILKTPILYKHKVIEIYVQTMISLDFNLNPVSRSPHYNSDIFPTRWRDRKACKLWQKTSWTDYLIQFKMIAELNRWELNRWDSLAKAYELDTSLRGDAQTVLSEIINNKSIS